jgi:hypothetical protein
MPISNSVTASTSAATANIAAPRTASTSAAMENSWAAPLPRTYFVGGFRVEHVRDTMGRSRWTCDCVDFVRAQRSGSGNGCQHTQRIAATAELDKLLRTPGLIMPPGCY